MKIVSLIWGYTHKNAGDLAMTLAAIDLLPSNNLKLKVFSLFHKKTNEFNLSKNYLLKRYPHHNLEVIGSPFYFNKEEKNPFKIIIQYFNIILILLNIIKIHYFRKKLLESQVIFFNGGNMFRCISLRDAFRMFCVFYPIKIGIKNSIPCVILPQSSASINKLGRTFLFSFLHKVNTIYLRERRSFEIFNHKYGLNNTKLGMDLAFFINKNGIKLSKSLINRHIAFTIRGRTIGDNAPLSQDKLLYLENIIHCCIERLSKKNKITIVVQVPIDRDFSGKIKQRYNKKIQLFEDTDPVSLLEFYSTVDLLIGMRLHSMILAMSVGTPCYGLFFKEWGNKVPGILEIFKMPYLELDNYPQINFEEFDKMIDSKMNINKVLLSSVEKYRNDLANEIEHSLSISEKEI